jgi:hypothetical protein
MSSTDVLVNCLRNVNLCSNSHKNYKIDILQKLINKNQHLAPQGSKEWLDMRVFNIGGSEMATITGDNGFSTMEQLVAQKIGLRNFNGNRATRWGKLFENITDDLTRIMLEIDSDMGIFETGSLEGAVAHQRYSPDGLAVVKLKCATTINDEEFETEEYCIVLFEYKSPFSSIPTKNIPKYYLPQVKTGLCSIPITDLAIFVNNMYRKCSLSMFEFNELYDIEFHDGDIKKKVKPTNPMAMGIIMFYQTADQRMRFQDTYKNKITNDSGEAYQNLDDSDSDSDDPGAFFQKIEDNKTNGSYESNVNNIYNRILHKDLIDFGESHEYEFEVMLQLYDDGLLSTKFYEPCVFRSEYHRIPFLVAQGKSQIDTRPITDMIQNQIDNIQTFKDSFNELNNNPIGYLPWKMFKSSMIYQERDETYVHRYNEKIQEVIQTIRDLGGRGDNLYETARKFDDKFPNNKITQIFKESQPAYIISMLPQGMGDSDDSDE